MKNTLLHYGLLGFASVGLIGGTWVALQSSDNSLTADLAVEDASAVNIESQDVVEPLVIESDVLSEKEQEIADVLDISAVKNDPNSDEILDITEHKAVETSEIFGVVRTDLSFRIKGNQGIGALSFDKVYGQEFLLTSGELDAEKMEEYIKNNIRFIGSETSCEIDVEYTPHNKDEERLSMIYDTYTFNVIATCLEGIESVSIANTLFYDERTSFAHAVNIFTRKRASMNTLKGMLLTPENPTLEWNTDKEIEDKDTDADGLLDGEEVLYGTDINLYDTDGDGDSDYKEVERGTDPLVPHTY